MTESESKEIEKKDNEEQADKIEAELLTFKTQKEALEQEWNDLDEELTKKLKPMAHTKINQEKIKEVDIRQKEIRQKLIELNAIIRELEYKSEEYKDIILKKKEKKYFDERVVWQKEHDRIQALKPEERWLDYVEKNNIITEKCFNCKGILYDDKLYTLWKEVIEPTLSTKNLFPSIKIIPKNQYECLDCGSVYSLETLELYKAISLQNNNFLLLADEIKGIKTNYNDLFTLLNKLVEDKDA